MTILLLGAMTYVHASSSSALDIEDQSYDEEINQVLKNVPHAIAPYVKIFLQDENPRYYSETIAALEGLPQEKIIFMASMINQLHDSKERRMLNERVLTIKELSVLSLEEMVFVTPHMKQFFRDEMMGQCGAWIAVALAKLSVAQINAINNIENPLFKRMGNRSYVDGLDRPPTLEIMGANEVRCILRALSQHTPENILQITHLTEMLFPNKQAGRQRADIIVEMASFNASEIKSFADAIHRLKSNIYNEVSWDKIIAALPYLNIFCPPSKHWFKMEISVSALGDLQVEQITALGLHASLFFPENTGSSQRTEIMKVLKNASIAQINIMAEELKASPPGSFDTIMRVIQAQLAAIPTGHMRCSESSHCFRTTTYL